MFNVKRDFDKIIIITTFHNSPNGESKSVNTGLLVPIKFALIMNLGHLRVIYLM